MVSRLSPVSLANWLTPRALARINTRIRRIEAGN
jgi:hypothetical protein